MAYYPTWQDVDPAAAADLQDLFIIRHATQPSYATAALSAINALWGLDQITAEAMRKYYRAGDALDHGTPPIDVNRFACAAADAQFTNARSLSFGALPGLYDLKSVIDAVRAQYGISAYTYAQSYNATDIATKAHAAELRAALQFDSFPLSYDNTGVDATVKGYSSYATVGGVVLYFAYDPPSNSKGKVGLATTVPGFLQYRSYWKLILPADIGTFTKVQFVTPTFTGLTTGISAYLNTGGTPLTGNTALGVGDKLLYRWTPTAVAGALVDVVDPTVFAGYTAGSPVIITFLSDNDLSATAAADQAVWSLSSSFKNMRFITE